MRTSSHLTSRFMSTTAWPIRLQQWYHVKVLDSKNGLESQKKSYTHQLTQPGLWGHNTNGLLSIGLLRPTESFSEIRSNHITLCSYQFTNFWTASTHVNLFMFCLWRLFTMRTTVNLHRIYAKSKDETWEWYFPRTNTTFNSLLKN